MARSLFRFLIASCLSFVLLSVTLWADGWRFDGTGRFPAKNPPVNWSKENNIAWKAELPGRSLASPVIVGTRAFVTSDPAELICFSIQDGEMVWQQSHEYANLFGAAKGEKIEADLTLAKGVRKQRDDLNRERGEAKKAEQIQKAEQLQAKIELLDNRYRELIAYPPKPGGDTGNSTSTPVCDGKDIYAVFATGIVSSHSLAGKRNWMTYVEGARGDHSASPLLLDGKLIVHLRDVVALDARNGDVLWRVKTDERHGSPVAAEIAGAAVLVTANGDIIRVSDGELIVKRQFRLGHNSPIVEAGTVYALEDGAVKAFQLPSSTELPADSKLELKWELSSTRANQLASPIVHNGLLYGVGERGILEVADVKTGKRIYRKRLDFGGGRVDASLCLAGELLFVSSTRGVTLVLKPGREFEQVTRNELEGFSSSLAFSENRMFARTPKHLICIKE
ncbi:MAG: outer membrane protein assembly factor BamB [Pirellulaceae bacterium]|jgi:outer membrane protein assembly factor BamB